MGLLYEIGDIVTLRKRTSLRQQGLGNSSCRGGFSPEMSWLRQTDHGSQDHGGEKYKKI